MGIHSISKQPWCDCPHQGPGCRIYSERPGECKEFACLWLNETDPQAVAAAKEAGIEPALFLRNMERPDHIGIMLTLTEPSEHIPDPAIVAREVRPGAFKEPGADDLINRLARSALVIKIGHRSSTRHLIGPATLVRYARNIKIVEKNQYEEETLTP